MTDPEELLYRLQTTTSAIPSDRWRDSLRVLLANPEPVRAAWADECAATRATPWAVWLPGVILASLVAASRSEGEDLPPAAGPAPVLSLPAAVTSLLGQIGRAGADLVQAAAAITLGRLGWPAATAVMSALDREPDGDGKVWLYAALHRVALGLGTDDEHLPILGGFAAERLSRELSIAATMGPAMADPGGAIWLLALLRAPGVREHLDRLGAGCLEQTVADHEALAAFVDRQCLPLSFGDWLAEANAVITDRLDPVPQPVRIAGSRGAREKRPGSVPLTCAKLTFPAASAGQARHRGAPRHAAPAAVHDGNGARPTSCRSGVRPAGGSVPAAAAPSVGRNEPCPCGSGRKFKKCCGA